MAPVAIGWTRQRLLTARIRVAISVRPACRAGASAPRLFHDAVTHASGHDWRFLREHHADARIGAILETARTASATATGLVFASPAMSNDSQRERGAPPPLHSEAHSAHGCAAASDVRPFLDRAWRALLWERSTTIPWSYLSAMGGLVCLIGVQGFLGGELGHRFGAEVHGRYRRLPSEPAQDLCGS